MPNLSTLVIQYATSTTSTLVMQYATSTTSTLVMHAVDECMHGEQCKRILLKEILRGINQFWVL